MKNKKILVTNYSIDNLPKTRKEQFKDILKVRFRTLIMIGLLLLLFFVPTIISIIIKDSMIIAASNAGDSLKPIYLYFSLAMIPCLIIFMIGVSGIIQIMKLIIWNDPVFFWHDFKTGIKLNFKAFLIGGLIASIFNFLASLFTVYFETTNAFVSYIPEGINCIIVYPICMISILLATFYTNNLGTTIKSSLYIYFKYFIYLIIPVALILLPILTLLIPYVIIKVVIQALLIMVYFPIALLILYLLQVEIYDELINKKQYPSIYKKGLRIK